MVMVFKCLGKKSQLPKWRAAQKAEKDAASDSWKLKVENCRIETRDMFQKQEIQILGTAVAGTWFCFTSHAVGLCSILIPGTLNQLSRFPLSLSLLFPLLCPSPHIIHHLYGVWGIRAHVPSPQQLQVWDQPWGLPGRAPTQLFIPTPTFPPKSIRKLYHLRHPSREEVPLIHVAQ